METSKKKKHDLQPRSSFWRQHYPLVAIIATIIALSIYFIIKVTLFELELSTMLYPLLGTGIWVDVIVSFHIFTIALLVILRGIFVRTISNNRTIATMFSDFVAFLLVGFTGLMILVVFVLTVDDTYTRKDTLNVNNQEYALASRNTYDDLGYGVFIFYECDNRVLFCSKIDVVGWGYTSHTAELAFDEETQAINIVVNGEVVYSHPLE